MLDINEVIQIKILIFFDVFFIIAIDDHYHHYSLLFQWTFFSHFSLYFFYIFIYISFMLKER
jgi:hypothetical protein